MRNLFIFLGAAGLLGASAPMVHAAFSDDFSTGQASVSNNANSGLVTGATLMTANFSRTLSTSIVANTAPGDARARTAIASGVFTFSSDNEATGLGFVDYTFGTPISLTTTPAFQFTLLSNDVLGTLNFSEYDTSGHVVSTSVPLPAMVSSVPLILTVPANQVGVTFNSASISKLEFSFGGTKGEDLSVDGIVAVAVPEPGSLVLLGAAAGAGLLVHRRRRA